MRASGVLTCLLTAGGAGGKSGGVAMYTGGGGAGRSAAGAAFRGIAFCGGEDGGFGDSDRALAASFRATRGIFRKGRPVAPNPGGITKDVPGIAVPTGCCTAPKLGTEGIRIGVATRFG